MADDVARAVGAGLSDTITIAGKACYIKPLGLTDLAEIERTCVKTYRRRYLELLADTKDIDPKGEEKFQEAVEKSARWEADDLPKKEVYDTSSIHSTPRLERWLIDRIGGSAEANIKKSGIRAVRLLVAAALDSEMMTDAEFIELLGKPPKKLRTGYVNWWITGCIDGMLATMHQVFKHQGITMDELIEDMRKDQARMAELSRQIESLSVPESGNGQGSPE